MTVKEQKKSVHGSSSVPLQAGSKLTFVSNADSENEPGGPSSQGLPLLSRQDRKTIQPRGSRSHFIISCHVAPTHLSALAWRRPGDSS
ncbi:unnamed protein product, partial [Arctogadus glacialis]